MSLLDTAIKTRKCGRLVRYWDGETDDITSGPHALVRAHTAFVFRRD